MDSFKNVQQTTLTSVVSPTPSAASGIHFYDIVPKLPMLSRRMTLIKRVSIVENAPATVSFHNINYIVGAKAESSKRRLACSALPFFKPREPKQVLFDVSGKFINGMNAILGKIFFTLLFKNY